MPRFAKQIILITALIPAAAFAAIGDLGDTGGSLYNPLGDITLWQLAIKIMNFIIEIGAIVIVFMVVYTGFKFVVARGNESALTEAKRMLLWTIIGAVILLGAKAITLGVCATVAALSTSASISCPTF